MYNNNLEWGAALIRTMGFLKEIKSFTESEWAHCNQKLVDMLNDDLTCLARAHKTDKGCWMKPLPTSDPKIVINGLLSDDGWPSIQHSGHNYTLIYYELLKKYRYKKINILELGVGDTGASVKMWRDFFPNANVTLFDPFFLIDENVVVTPKELQNLNINVVIGNQLSEEDLLKTIEHEDYKFDIIIDDASHVSDGVQISLATLFPYLKEDGYYFIEDLYSMRSRDTRLEDVNSWLDGPAVNQKNKKIYHREETHVIDSIASLLGESGNYKSKILSSEQILYLENNLKFAAAFRDLNYERNLLLLRKQNLSKAHSWLTNGIQRGSDADKLRQKLIKVFLDK